MNNSVHEQRSGEKAGELITGPPPHVIEIELVTLAMVPVQPSARARSAKGVEQQRSASREALRLCAGRCGAPLDGWHHRANGAPVPNVGWFWSQSHKRCWAGACISREHVGLDIEAITPRRVELYEEIGSAEEWLLLGGRTWPHFFRLWTAKEATVKAHGLGIGALDMCQLSAVESAEALTMIFQEVPWRVWHVYFDNHLAAVATPIRTTETGLSS